MSDIPDHPPPSEWIGLPAEGEVLLYAMRCAANWLEERGGRSDFDDPGPIGIIRRWDRDNPRED